MAIPHFQRIAILVVLAICQSSYSQNTQTVWLHEMNTQQMQTGWGKPGVNKSIDGNPLKVGGKNYEHGVGLHAPAFIRIALHKQALKFSAKAGIDQEDFNSGGSAEFMIDCDGKEKWHSGKLEHNDKARDVEVDLRGVSHLLLSITDAGDGTGRDHVDWLEAKIEYNGKKPETVSMDTFNPADQTIEFIKASKNKSKNVLWYNKPASKWLEALPLGNGRRFPKTAKTLTKQLMKRTRNILRASIPPVKKSCRTT